MDDCFPQGGAMGDAYNMGQRVGFMKAVHLLRSQDADEFEKDDYICNVTWSNWLEERCPAGPLKGKE